MFKGNIAEMDGKCNQVLGDNSDMTHTIEKLEDKLKDARSEIKDLYTLNMETNDKLKAFDFKFKKFELAKDD